MNKFALGSLCSPADLTKPVVGRSSLAVRKTASANDVRRTTNDALQNHRGAQKSQELASRPTEVGALANFVRSPGFKPEPFPLTTGTFNLIVKDRTAIRLSGAHSVQNELNAGAGVIARAFPRARRAQLHRIRLSSKPFKVTSSVAGLSTHRAHRISTGNAHGASSF
jgi:hypothetical protein